MNCDYKDIRDRIPDPPVWFDEHCVPRWCEFAPDEVANIYADQVALLRVDCQSCGHQFRVAVSESESGCFLEALRRGKKVERLEELRRLSDYAAERAIGIGDPPNIGCCGAGPTMSSVARRVVEFWRKENFDWARCPELEVRLDEGDE